MTLIKWQAEFELGIAEVDYEHRELIELINGLYPFFEEHKDNHETLLDDLRDIMDEIEDDGSFDHVRLSNDLNRWFGDHFATHDARLHRTSQASA